MTISRLRSTRSEATAERLPELLIERLGEEGDGVARDQAGALRHVAGALPGERVRARGSTRLEIVELLSRSKSRAEPVCALAGRCGGCALQHMTLAASLAWKSARVAGALAADGGSVPVMRPPFQTAPRTRRRMDLAVSRDGRLVIGLHRRGERMVVDMTECHVLHPALFALIDPLRALLPSLDLMAAGTGSVIANLIENGPDLLLRTDRPASAGDRGKLAEFARAHAVSRISWSRLRPGTGAEPEALVLLARPRLPWGPLGLEPPPGAFLQATEDAEAALIADVLEGLPPSMPRRKVIVELYAGCGTLSFPLARHGIVRAYEGDAMAVGALKRAAGGTRIQAHHRDLARAPVTVSELRDAHVAVLDPPHGGAGRQIDEVAQAGVGTVILVSCNPSQLRREAGVLYQAGYRLVQARAIDQFLFSPRIESVSVFRRD